MNENTIPKSMNPGLKIRRWLHSRGGRGWGDLRLDRRGYYVWMRGRRGHDERVYLPDMETWQEDYSVDFDGRGNFLRQ